MTGHDRIKLAILATLILVLPLICVCGNVLGWLGVR